MLCARRSSLLPRLCLLLAACFLWSFAVAPCAVAAARKTPARSVPRLVRRFPSAAARLANTPYAAPAHVTSPAASRARAVSTNPARPLSLLDEVGHLSGAVTPARVAAWKRELKTTHPAAARAARLHL